MRWLVSPWELEEREALHYSNPKILLSVRRARPRLHHQCSFHIGLYLGLGNCVWTRGEASQGRRLTLTQYYSIYLYTINSFMINQLTVEQQLKLKRGKAIRTGLRNKAIEIDRLIAEAMAKENN